MSVAIQPVCEVCGAKVFPDRVNCGCVESQLPKAWSDQRGIARRLDYLERMVCLLAERAQAPKRGRPRKGQGNGSGD